VRIFNCVATMSVKKDHERMDILDKIFRSVQQSSAKGGTRAVEIAQKLNIHRATVHRHLSSLELMGKVEDKGGRWFAKVGEQSIKPSEKEIVIMLPLPKNLVAHAMALEAHARLLEDSGFEKTASTERIILEKIDESRSIKITGKNVDDIDLVRMGELIQQASQKGSRLKLRSIIKKLRMPDDVKAVAKNMDANFETESKGANKIVTEKTSSET
jgi:hypothetical protein